MPDHEWYDEIQNILVQVSTDLANLKQRVFAVQTSVEDLQAITEVLERQRDDARKAADRLNDLVPADLLEIPNIKFDMAYEADEYDRLTGRIL